MFVKSMKNRIKIIMSFMGPGFIIASLVLGPGSLTVSSKIGASYGYSFLWIIVLAVIPMITYTSIAARYGVLHKDTLLFTISKTYGKWFSIIIGTSVFIATTSFQFGNNLGIGIAISSITETPEFIWPIVFTSTAVLLIFWTKNLYKALEKIMIAMVLIMILSFFINIIIVKPNIVAVAKGFIPASTVFNHTGELIALTGTTFALVGALFQSYLVQDKGWNIKNLKQSLHDTKIGIVILGFISALIIITSATALHPKGIEVNSAADMALQLEALFGNSAKYIFSIGLAAAAFSSLVVNAIIGGSLLSDSLGLGKSMNDKFPKIFTLVILLIGMVIAIFFKGNIIYAIILAQGATLLGVPFIALALFLIANNKKIMGEYVNNKRQNIIAVFGFGLVSLMVFFLIKQLFF